MTKEVIYLAVITVAFVLGALAGRVFAVEARSRPAAAFAATYIGAGTGLAFSIPASSLLTVAMQLLNPEWEFSTLFDAIDMTGNAIALGVASGATGGLLIGLVVVAGFNRWSRSGPLTP